MFKFIAGQPACPVACKYCFITEHDTRREVWNENPIAGINKAATYINVPPWINEDRVAADNFEAFPWGILKGDFVGFTAITDPFWPRLEKWIKVFLEKASAQAKIITCVSKWPLGQSQVETISQYENFFLVVSITGNNPPVEKVSVRKHLETLKLAKESGVKALPIIHPYISGVSDLSFLSELRDMGYAEISAKGLRYCHAHMSSWMPESSQKDYVGKEDEEILPEDGWRDKVEQAGFSLLSPKEWYVREGMSKGPHLSLTEAEEYVKRVLELANITSSAEKEAVWEAAVKRRL